MVFGKARMKLLANEPGATADVRKVPVWKVLHDLSGALHGFAAGQRSRLSRRLAGDSRGWFGRQAPDCAWIGRR
jgi:hypothetical protein